MILELLFKNGHSESVECTDEDWHSIDAKIAEDCKWEGTIKTRRGGVTTVFRPIDVLVMKYYPDES